jgi:hypothetical protein
MIGIGRSAFRRFGGGGSEVAFLIAGFLRLSVLTLRLLSPGLFVVRFEHRGCSTVEELVESVEPVFAGGDPKSDFRRKCMPQARPGHVV